jgi:gliding motility-associated-like protein
VEITDTNGCYATDTAQATVFTLPVVNLGNDTTLCPGFTITFDAGPGYVNYLWQDASTAQTFLANTAGMYGVVVTDTNNCQGADAVQLSYFAPPVANLGPDVSFCSGDSVVLNPGAFSSYAWWNGAGTPTATANSAGWYWVTVTDGNNCTDTDSMQVQNVYANPVVNLGPDTSFCAGESIVLNPGAGYVSYLWQDASVNPTFTTSSQGVYSVTVTDMNNCTGSDAMSVVNVYPLPAFTLGPDFGLCRGDQFQIEPDGPSVPVTYRWRDDSNNSFFNVTDTGRYWLTVTDVNGCTFGDTVEVFLNCPPTLYIPNAFSPNNDPYNPLFQAYGTNIRNFKMEIFNRWGEFVTELNSMTDSWDGTYGSAPAPQGVYVYKVWYMDFESEDVKTLHGRVSLIR